MKITSAIFDRRHSNERGEILVWVTLAGVLLLVFVAIAFDTGFFYQHKRRMQTAADSAALAAALEKKRNADVTTTDMETIGRQDAGTNGFTHGSNNITVEILTPPNTGNYGGQTGYVQATITQQHPTFFASLLHLLTPGSTGFNQTTVRARAVAGPASSNCIYVLNPNAPEALRIHSGTTVNAGCGVQVNSTSSRGLSVTSNSHLISTDVNLSATGYEVLSGSSISPAPDSQQEAITDPLSWLQPPATSPCNHTDRTIDLEQDTSMLTIDQGVYCGGLLIKKGIVTMNPGNYIMVGSSSRGGLVVEGSTTRLQGSGVFIYNGGLTNCTSGPEKCRIYIKSGSTMSVTAPQTGTYAGIAIFQERALLDNDKLEVLFESGSHVQVEGTIYVPFHKYMHHSDASGLSSAGWTAVVARTMEFSSHSTVGINGNTTSVPNPLRRIALVE